MVTTILVVLLILVTLYNLVSIRSLRKRVEDTRDSIQSSVAWAKEDLRNDMSGMKAVVRVLAAGGRVTTDMVEEGRPYADMSAAEVQKLLSGTNKAVVLDVRTHEEYMAGHIPGCRLIPVDEVENRALEVPRDAEPLLVICQGGGRSAAACEILSKKGFTNLVNVYDGMGAYPGKREIGISIRPPAPKNS